MGSSGSLWTQVIVIIVLTAINAFFAASEIAFVSVNQSKMKALAEEGNKKAQRVLELLENSDDFLATIQVAITLAGFLSSASAATSFADRFSALLPTFPGAVTVAIVVVTLILSYITLVFGELFPKQVALQMPEKIAMGTSGIIGTIQKIFRPFIALLSASTGLLQRLTPLDFSENDEKFTRDEMKVLMAESRKEGSIDLAKKIVNICEKEKDFKPIYELSGSIREKIETIAKEIYGATGITYSEQAIYDLEKIEKLAKNMPVCIAKTQYSFSDDPKNLLCEEPFNINVTSIEIKNGAEFVVVKAGKIMTMPGLPKNPAAEKIDIDENGNIIGIF